MELNQVSYFINLAETLNFTAAARLSGCHSQSDPRDPPEDELGGPLIYRDGKNSRLTGLGHDVEAEFRRMVVAMKSVAITRSTGRWGHRVLDVAVAPTVGPKELTAFFESALAEMPSIEIKLHSLQSNEDTSEVLSENTTRASCRVKQDRNASWMCILYFGSASCSAVLQTIPWLPTRSCAAKTCSSFLSSIA
jgi:hypothetical protein